MTVSREKIIERALFPHKIFLLGMLIGAVLITIDEMLKLPIILFDAAAAAVAVHAVYTVYKAEKRVSK